MAALQRPPLLYQMGAKAQPKPPPWLNEGVARRFDIVAVGAVMKLLWPMQFFRLVYDVGILRHLYKHMC